MLAVAWQTLRGRWVSFAGMLLALALGVCLLSLVLLALAATFTVPVQAPERFKNAPVVVYPSDTVTVETPVGVRSTKALEPGVLPDDVVTKVTSLSPSVVERNFYAQIASVKAEQVGRAWPVAALGPYQLVAGSAPQADTDIVVTEGQAALHQKVTVLTPEGARIYTVSGLVNGVDFESAIFFSNSEAQRLSPKVNALATYADAQTVRQAVGSQAQVLTGNDRHLADPNPTSNFRALNNIQIILGIAGGFTAFVAVFVVASTFAFVVVQRQREFAMLRAIGATPNQVWRMVLFETLLVALLAAVIGILMAALLTPFFAAWLIDLGVAPEWFRVPFTVLPVLIAALIGVAVALLGAWAASRRASAAKPLQAMGDAAVDAQGLSRSRQVWAWVCLVLGIIAMAWIAFTNPHIAVVPQIYLGALMLPVIAAALFAPAIVPPLARLITWPLQKGSGAIAMVARQTTLAAVRRTVSAAVPVLLVVGLFVSLLGAVDAIASARSAELAAITKSTHVITPDVGTNISPQVLGRLQDVPDTTATATTSVAVYALDEDRLMSYEAETINPQLATTMLNVPLESGSLADLRDDTIIVNQDWNKNVGDFVDVWFGSGAKDTLRVVGVMSEGVQAKDAYLSARHAMGVLPSLVYVNTNAPDKVQAALEGQDAHLVAVRGWAAGARDGNVQASHVGMLVTLGIIGLYGGIALANTLVIAAVGRKRDIATLRFAGAAPGQIFGILALEAVIIVAVGTVLALIVALVNALGHHTALNELVAGVPITVPWLVLWVTAGISALVAIPAAILPVLRNVNKGEIRAG